MNLLQLSENLQCAEMVIQFCQEKNLIGKIKSCWACEHPCHLKKNEEKLYILLITFLNKPELIFFHTVKWFQVFLSNTNNSIYY